MRRIQCFASVLLLSSFLYSGVGFIGTDRTLAAPHGSASDTAIARRNEETPRNIRRGNNVPAVAVIQIRQDLARRLGIPPGQVKVVSTVRQTWPDGCLGIPDPLALCSQALVPGWRVVVEGKGQQAVYRTNASGSIVKFDPTASQTPQSQGIQPLRLSDREIPQPLTNNVVFRAISSGGIAGQRYATLLLRDGRIVRVPINDQGFSGEAQIIGQASQQQIREFEQLLRQQGFSQFNGLTYPAPRGAADFITVTLTGQQGTTQYADIIQDQLPASLRMVIQQWNQMTTRRG